MYVGRGSRRINSAAAARPTLANAARDRCSDVDAAAGHHRLGEAESPLELTLFAACRSSRMLGRHDHVDADQSV